MDKRMKVDVDHSREISRNEELAKEMVMQLRAINMKMDK